ncbi:hypothetical protein DXG01_003158, partial [Tephrocybe rancida]
NPNSDLWVYPVGLLPDPNPETRRRSFSCNLGWNGIPSVCKDWEEENENATSLTPSPSQQDHLVPTKDIPPRHPSQPLELVTLWEERCLWIHPPIISKVGVGLWEQWSMDIEDGVEQLWRIKGDDKGYTYYDHELRRIFMLEYALVSPLGLTTDRDCFSLPAPDMPYEKKVGDAWQTATHSRWWYTSKYPTKEQLQAQIIEPTPEELPLLTSAKGKSAAVFTSMMDSDEEEELLESDHEDDIFKIPIVPSRKTSNRPEFLAPSHNNDAMTLTEDSDQIVDTRMENANLATRIVQTLQLNLQMDESPPPSPTNLSPPTPVQTMLAQDQTEHYEIPLDAVDAVLVK